MTDKPNASTQLDDRQRALLEQIRIENERDGKSIASRSFTYKDGTLTINPNLEASKSAESGR